MAAHRRTPRTAGIQGFVRFSAVSLTVASAAVATACGVGGSKNDAAQSVSVAAAPDAPSDQGTGTPAPMEAATAPASPTATATSVTPTTRPSASASPPVAERPAAATKAAPRPARTTAAPAPTAPAPTKPAVKKRAPVSGSSGFTSGYPSGADARGAVTAAVAAARADGKKVLIDFGANWCGNCKAADRVFATSDVGALLDASYHVVKVDIGGQDSSAFDLLRDYCSGEGAYKMPVLVVLDGNGKVVTETHSTGNPELTETGLGAFLRKWAR
ncbi:thioredoxin family protein [Streptomyces sp. NBC_00691]|uniref:thioredoxin family protein n=1 Tax=Streptomyces sp. NBC_00691 TaxID=2903671 RepID=UPI002E32698E|nr:thioredoxin family protein [Streptomyces sp. NBC_00691]